MDGKTILIVDDDENLVKALALKLRSAGYTVLVGLDGMQALMQAQRKDPDLILMDVTMPAGDGLSVLDKLHHSIRTRQIPVIMMSAASGDNLEEDAKQMGAIGFLHKPFDADKLIKAIDIEMGAQPAG